MHCTLCFSDHLKELRPPKDRRAYYQCQNCLLIFTDEKYHLTIEDEKYQYKQHNNGIDQPGYVEFLSRVIDPALHYLHGGMTGCDYGCGPSPTLSKIIEKKGIQCDNYDPAFGFVHLREKYDFIFSTECFEHFFYPARDIVKIDNLLKVNGYLMVMTLQYHDLERFQNWFYKRDPTHVSFYHNKTFDYICEEYNYSMKLNDKFRVVILQKN